VVGGTDTARLQSAVSRHRRAVLPVWDSPRAPVFFTTLAMIAGPGVVGLGIWAVAALVEQL
jgi:hypothetical protein